MAKSDKPFGLFVPKKGKTWVYDFQVDGKRYSKSTRKTRYLEALKVAGARHAEATGAVQRTSTKRLPDMPLREVFGRYFNEKASLLKSADDLLSALNRMALSLGPDLPLSQLKLGDLMEYQVRRRKEGVSNRTVNYEVPELIRPVVKRAKKWGIEVGELGSLTDDDWAELKLPLPAPRNRSASRAELVRLLRSLRKDYRPILMFARLTGLRLSAWNPKRDQLDWENMVMWYPKKSKLTGDKGWLPITPQIARIFRGEIQKGGEKCEYVFTYQRQRGDGRSPITVSGIKTEMKKAVKKAELKDWRLNHDVRHTAATEALRSSQNLAGVKEMLGHSNISQTSRYAHVMIEDVRNLMVKRSPVKIT